MKVIFEVITMAVGAVSLIAFVSFLMVGDRRTDGQICTSTAIEWAGYNQCMTDEICNLSNDEQYRMYILYKEGLFACGKEIARSLFLTIEPERTASNE